MTYQSEQELEQLNLFNYSKLNGVQLTDKEFRRVLTYLEGESIFTSSKLFRDKFILEREDGTSIYLEFFDSTDWHNNIFQVTNQVTMQSKYVNRYDVTVLINGLPMVQIELKRRGKDFKEAFNQIERYRYIQIFIISNGVDTKYYANSDKDIKFDFTFFWSDDKNKRISNLNHFAQTFLDRFNLNNV